METATTRRRAGELIHAARVQRRLSQRALAREAGISETWLRALTAGLRGDDPQRAPDDTWIALARAVGVDVEDLFATLERPLPEDTAEEAPEPDPSERFVVERTTYEGRLLEIVHDLEADTDDLPDEVAEEIIRRSLEAVSAQARVYAELERRRWERGQEQEKGEG